MFFVGPRDEQSEAITQLHTNLKSVLFTKQYTIAEITALFDSMPDREYYNKWGGRYANAIAPANDRPGSNLFLMSWQSLAYDLMTTYEFLHNHQYEWVLSVRPDMDFATPLPPVDVLRKARERHGHEKVVWVMNSNQHYMGVTDRFAIMSRNASDVYFGRWKAMLAGTFASQVNYTQCGDCNSERMLKMWLESFGVPIKGMPPVGAIKCSDAKYCTKETPCFTSCDDGRKYKYDDGNPANEWAVTAGFRNSFKGWNANML